MTKPLDTTALDKLRRQLARALGINVSAPSEHDAARLDLAVALRVELDALSARQMAGAEVDLARLLSAGRELQALLTPPKGAEDWSSMIVAINPELGMGCLVGGGEPTPLEKAYQRATSEIMDLKSQLAMAKPATEGTARTDPGSAIEINRLKSKIDGLERALAAAEKAAPAKQTNVISGLWSDDPIPPGVTDHYAYRFAKKRGTGAGG